MDQLQLLNANDQNVIKGGAMKNNIDSLQRLREMLQASNYLDKMTDELYLEMQKLFSMDETALVERLYSIIHRHYERLGHVGKGFHCLEHVLELAVLLLKVYNYQQTAGKENELSDAEQKSLAIFANHKLPNLYKFEVMEMLVVAILHNHDPFRIVGPPQLNRTLDSLYSDESIRDIIERLSLSASNIGLMIERIVSPYTLVKSPGWNTKLEMHIKQHRSRDRFIQKSEFLNLLDKASIYYSLSPEEADKRIEGLEDELGLPKQSLLIKTSRFLKEKGINQLAQWVPENYRQKWSLIERHYEYQNTLFMNVFGYKS